ncbi:MAG: hypothetical protein CL878_10865 [Dehalococcoidia bacterium]|nr:hypothetical protein [Dehalococcoidia bacterium]
MSLQFALMDHVEGTADTPSGDVFAEVLVLAEQADELGLGIVTSRERPLANLQEIVAAHRKAWDQAGWSEPPQISAGFGLYVGADDRSAEADAAATTWLLWERMATRPQWSDLAAPASTAEAGERVGFLHGGPETVAQAIVERHRGLPLTHVHV